MSELHLEKEHSENRINDMSVNRQWLEFTEIVRRNILSSSDFREKVASFVTAPLAEKLPLEFFEAINDFSQEIDGMRHQFKDKLLRLLKIPSIPDSAMSPDVKHAGGGLSPSISIDEVLSDENIERVIRRMRTSKDYVLGCSEKEIIFRRYEMARDVKLLALMAEMQHEKVIVDKKGESVLNSGVKVCIDPNKDKNLRDLLFNPERWEKRRQIKDRVYKIIVGGQKYILKERKTKTHRDTVEHGHQEGLTSSEEYNLARHLQENASMETEEFKVSWEDPIGYVEFPDGYQFVLFEYEDAFDNYSNNFVDTFDSLRGDILNHREDYIDEYNLVKNRVITMVDPETEPVRSKLRSVLGKGILKFIKHLSFEDYAEVKAYFMLFKAVRLMEDLAYDNGKYGLQDTSHVFRFKREDNKTQLEIIGFDFENVEQGERSAWVYERREQINLSIVGSRRSSVERRNRWKAYKVLLEMERKAESFK